MHRHPRGGCWSPLLYGRPHGVRYEGISRTIGSIFSGPPKAAKPPPPPAPVPMPDMMDPAVLAAQRRRLEDAYGRSGRASTLLTGGDDYSNDKLGSR